MKYKNITLQCSQHKTYTGTKNPKNDCIICWKIRVSYLITKIKQLKERLNVSK